MRKLHTVFHSNCTILYSYQLCKGIEILHNSIKLAILIQHFFLIVIILRGRRWYHFVVLFFPDNDIKHLFICVLVIDFFKKKCVFKSFVHLLIRLLVFCWVVFWILTPYLINSLQIFFSRLPFHYWLFPLLHRTSQVFEQRCDIIWTAFLKDHSDCWVKNDGRGTKRKAGRWIRSEWWLQLGCW